MRTPRVLTHREHFAAFATKASKETASSASVFGYIPPPHTFSSFQCWRF